MVGYEDCRRIQLSRANDRESPQAIGQRGFRAGTGERSTTMVVNPRSGVLLEAVNPPAMAGLWEELELGSFAGSLYLPPSLFKVSTLNASLGWIDLSGPTRSVPVSDVPLSLPQIHYQ